MGKNKRKRYSAEFKARVALEAISGEKTLSELGAKYEIHPNMIAGWKKKAIESLPETFSAKGEKDRKDDETQIRELYAKIGELTVERDFLSKAFGR